MEFKKTGHGIKVILDNVIVGWILKAQIGTLFYSNDKLAATANELREIVDKLDELNEA